MTKTGRGLCVLFPSSFDSLSKVDEDLLQEYEAAGDTGLFDLRLFDYDQWFNHGVLKMKNPPTESINAVYRGWMMKPEQYALFFHALQGFNVRLLTSPAEYERLHVFPNIYPQIKEITAPILTYPLHTEIAVEEVKNRFPRFLVKDYVKSVKGTEFPRYFDNTVTQEEFNNWMEVFYHYRGDLLTGGICVKEFLNLKLYDGHTNEYRVFYADHTPISICRNSGQSICTPELPQAMIDRCSTLDSPFYTVDFAEKEDDLWIVIETGDGGVSGPSDGQDLKSFFRALYYALKYRQ